MKLFLGQPESTVTNAWTGSHRRRGVGTHEKIRSNARSATATGTPPSATSTRLWTRWVWAWTSTASISAAACATIATPTRRASTARRALTATSDQSGSSPTTQRPACPVTARTRGTRATARRRTASASARKRSGGQTTAQLVPRFVGLVGLNWVLFVTALPGLLRLPGLSTLPL